MYETLFALREGHQTVTGHRESRGLWKFIKSQR